MNLDTSLREPSILFNSQNKTEGMFLQCYQRLRGLKQELNILYCIVLFFIVLNFIVLYCILLNCIVSIVYITVLYLTLQTTEYLLI